MSHTCEENAKTIDIKQEISAKTGKDLFDRKATK